MIRVAIPLSDIKKFCFLRGTLFNKRGPRLLTGKMEKRMGDRGTPTSNRREGGPLKAVLLLLFLYENCVNFVSGSYPALYLNWTVIPPPFFIAAFLSKKKESKRRELVLIDLLFVVRSQWIPFSYAIWVGNALSAYWYFLSWGGFRFHLSPWAFSSYVVEDTTCTFECIHSVEKLVSR